MLKYSDLNFMSLIKQRCKKFFCILPFSSKWLRWQYATLPQSHFSNIAFPERPVYGKKLIKKKLEKNYSFMDAGYPPFFNFFIIYSCKS